MENIFANHSTVAFDFNKSDFRSYESVLLHIALAFILCMFILIAVAGNILVCIAICTDRNLRHIGNTFVASLAIADLLVGLIVMPLALVNDLLGYWSLPNLLCGIWVSFDIMGSTASILNLCAISLDRYIHIKDPLHYNATVTPRVVIPCVVVIWILSIVVSFVPVNLGWHQPLPPENDLASLSSGIFNYSTPNPTILTRSLGLSNDLNNQPLGSSIRPILYDELPSVFQCNLEINPIYATTSSIISFYFPCIIMLIIYLRLYMEARRHVKSVKKMAHVVYYNSCSSSTNLSGLNGRTRTASDAVYSAQSRMVSEHKAAVTLGIIVTVFLVCLAPFFAINIIHAKCRCISIITFKALTWLGYCNSAFNPVIYSIFNQDFRKAFRKLLHLHICCVGGRSEPVSRERTFSFISGGSGTPTPTPRSRTRDQAL